MEMLMVMPMLDKTMVKRMEIITLETLMETLTEMETMEKATVQPMVTKTLGT